MAIDDPIDAFEQQYMNEEPELPVKLAKFAGDTGFKLALPDGGLALEILLKVGDALFDRASATERVKEMWELVKGEFRHVERTKASHEDVQKAIQLAIWYDRHERDDKKRERYVKMIGNALRSDTEINDLVTFVQTVEQLGEHDIAVLKMLNLVMNKPGDWVDQLGKPVTKLHPNTFIHRREELAKQVAQALGQKTDLTSQVKAGQTFSHEEGYSICARLQGFGLAHEVDTGHREIPIGDYCFRPSKRGLMLLKLLGEEVPNMDNFSQ